MRSCQQCDSERVLKVSGKTSDMCFVSLGQKERNGYVPGGLNIGEGDYLDFAVCLDCGQLQGKFPVAADAVPEGLAEV